MSGPSTTSGSGDDTCLEMFGRSWICQRPDGHPPIQTDGVGHSRVAIRIGTVRSQIQVYQERLLQVQEARFEIIDMITDPYVVRELLAQLREEEREMYRESRKLGEYAGP